MTIRQRGVDGVWQADFSIRGRRVVRSTGTTSRQEAQELHDQWRAQAWRETRLGEKPKVSFDAAAAAFVKARKGNRDIESTLDKLRFASEVKYRGRRIGGIPVDTITRDVLDTIIDAKRAHRAVSDATLNRYLAAVSAVLHFAHGKGWLDNVPKIEKLEEGGGSDLWLTQEQAVRLIRELPPHLAAMARFALATGLRRSNVTGLTWEQVDLSRGVAWINEEDSKSGEAIAIPLNEDAQDVLRGQEGRHDVFVFAYDGRAVTRTKTAAFEKAKARAGIDPRFRWHDLRHTWATWHVMNGTPLGELMKLGGWHSYDMVLRYAKFAPGHLAQYAKNSCFPARDPAFRPGFEN